MKVADGSLEYFGGDDACKRKPSPSDNWWRDGHAVG
jgi:hypothetical protein